MCKLFKKIEQINLLHLVFPFILFLVSNTSSAQSNQIFSNLKVKDGLPSSTIRSITQDSKGFMWFGSDNGLVRYDGYDVQSFKNNSSSNNNYANSFISFIAKGGGNTLWAGSSTGLIHLDTSTGENRRIDLGGDRDIRYILKQGDSILWVGSTDGLFKVNINDESFQLFNQQNSKLSSNIIRSLYLSKSNGLWIGTFDGLNQLKKDGTIKTFNLKNNYKSELENNLILDIKSYSATSDDFLWKINV